MPRPLFELGPRLALCAELTRPGASAADVGTDHGYLPIWLLKTGRIPHAVAADINEGPLNAAKQNAVRYEVGEALRFCLSDGLTGLAPADADDIVIAGMGGTLILRIVTEAPWLRDPGKRLVLQPMSCASELRVGLWDLGFRILEERACIDSNKVYTAFSAVFTGEQEDMPFLYPYMGRLEPGSEEVRAYAEKQCRNLQNQLKGASHLGDALRIQTLTATLDALTKKYL